MNYLFKVMTMYNQKQKIFLSDFESNAYTNN